MVIEEIISLIDQELEKKGKPYISVQSLNKLIKEADFNKENLSNPGSKLIKEGKIPHAFKFPKSNQWSIPHSNPEKVKNTRYRKCSECKFYYAVNSTLSIKESLFGPYHHYVICPHCNRKTGVPYYYADLIKGKKTVKNQTEAYNTTKTNNLSQRKSQRNWIIASATIFILTIMGLISDHISDTSRTPSQNIRTDRTQNQSSKGHYSTTYIVNTNTYASYSKVNYDNLFGFIINNDINAIIRLENLGLIIMLPKGTRVYLKENRFTYCIVRQEGSIDDLYVVTDHITKQ